jgi:hypothetical protein
MGKNCTILNFFTLYPLATYVKGLLFDFLKSKKNAVLMSKEVGRQLYRKWREGLFLREGR